MLRKITLIAILSPVVLLSVACGLTSPFIAHKDFTRANYETIRIGETKQEVLEMLGKPKKCVSDNAGGAVEHETWIYLNYKPYYQAAIEFEGGYVKHKRFTTDKSLDLTTPTTAPSTKPAKHSSHKVL